MVLAIVVRKKADTQCQRIQTRYRPQSPRPRGEDALRRSPRATREWMAHLSTPSGRPVFTAGLLALRGGRTVDRCFFSSSLRQRNRQDSAHAGDAVRDWRVVIRKRNSFDGCAAKSKAARTVPFLCEALPPPLGSARPIYSARFAVRLASRRASMRTRCEWRDSNQN